MKTERELFREWYENAYHEIINILPSGQYASLRQQHSWDAWQASAQREGYKLVPVNPTDEMISTYRDKSIAPISTLSVIGYKAMIGVADE